MTMHRFRKIGFVLACALGLTLQGGLSSCDHGKSSGDTTSETSCDNGVDEDMDGRTDCQDPDCSGDPACPETSCNDGLDNNNDGATDCDDESCLTSPLCRQFLALQSVLKDVDILFVIDDSFSMYNEQQTLQARFHALMSELTYVREGFPSVHIGVATTDLGTGQYSTITYCMEVGGDAGVLGRVKGVNLGETCLGPGQRYIVDVEPSGCSIEKDENNACTSHDCEESHCAAMAQADEVLGLYIDDKGCPRCRNFTTSLEEAFVCMATLGVSGCGFEQPLESMRKALDMTETPENNGFLRDNALLSVILVTDEDDCSASQPDILFNPDPAINRIDSELGFLDSFRCFEFGVSCDVGGRTLGARNDCEPDEESNMLHPISRYTGYLEALKNPLLTVVAAIGGPFDGSVNVALNSQEHPSLEPTCYDPLDPSQGATPGVRLKGFVEHFNNPDDMEAWAYTSICSTDFSPALSGIGEKIAGSMYGDICLPQPPAGCPSGSSGTSCSACLPGCTIYDMESWGQADQKKKLVPWCGHVCTSGLCALSQLEECTYDDLGKCTCQGGLSPTRIEGEEGCAPLHYPNGDPDPYGAGPEAGRIDPDLASILPGQEPTCTGTSCPLGTEGISRACWYVSQWACGSSVGLKVIRAAEPYAGTFVEGICSMAEFQETDCDNGIDDDQNCLTDCDDPHCSDDPGC